MKALQCGGVKALGADDFMRLFKVALGKIPSKAGELEQSSTKVGVAVSGGPDSMALVGLAVKALGPERVHAFIVDHGLQQLGVSEDSQSVLTALQGMGIKSTVLGMNWHGSLPTESKLMMQAREGRYRLLLDACNRNACSLLLTGHNLEDDIVTMFYRISRMSGLDGLAGMKLATNFPFPSPHSGNCFILRPLLTVPKASLVETCRSLGIKWSEDTSNDNINFRRNEALQSLIELQAENDKISTEALTQMLGFFKRQRQVLHEKMSAIMASSVIVNQSVGDATLILNSPSLTANRFLFTRILSNLVQIVTAYPYPAKTPSLNRVFDEVHAAYAEYQQSQKVKRGFNSQSSSTVKRIDFNQHTIAGATVYALSRNDSARRLDNFMQRSGRKLASGPALLIEREIPSRKERDGLAVIEHDFADGKPLLWDNRIFIDCSGRGHEDLTFTIRPLSLDIVKEFEVVTKSNFSARKNLYAYLGMTPASHLHIIPVLQHKASGFMALPTLNCFSNPGMFKCTATNAALGIITGKFLCLP